MAQSSEKKGTVHCKDTSTQTAAGMTNKKHCDNISNILCCTWEVLCFCVELPSVHWVRRPFLQSSSWGCSPSWWWRSEFCSACTLDCADDPSLHANRSSCGTTLYTKTGQTNLAYFKVQGGVLKIITLTGPHTCMLVVQVTPWLPTYCRSGNTRRGHLISHTLMQVIQLDNRHLGRYVGVFC